MPRQKTMTLAELLSQLARDQSDEVMRQAYSHLTLLTTSNIERVLGMLLDPMSFSDLETFAQGLKAAYGRVQQDNNGTGNLGPLLGTIGLVCFTLELLNKAKRQDQDVSSTDLAWPQTLLEEPTVQHWFQQVYAPPRSLAARQNSPTPTPEEANLKLAGKHWQDLDFDHLELYRVGTTSFILRCTSSVLSGEKLILKCLLFPYTRIPEIVKATRNYALNYPAGNVPATTRVRSSTDKWILMDEVEGITLREFLQKRRDAEDQGSLLLRTDLLILIGRPLLTALHELSRAGFRHEDLTPSNIMIVNAHDSIERIVLIDLGRNYLYTHDIGLEARREALFVAPEVKNGQNSEGTSDLYSFGMILIDLADPMGAYGETIPDNLYRYAPDLARFIEDVIDAKPERRRLLFPMKDKNDPYLNLGIIFTDVLKVLPSEREVKPGRFFWIEQLLALFYPSRRLAHARELWRITRSSSAHPEIARHTGRLYGWLLVSMVNTWLIFAVSLYLTGRDFGMNLLPTPISIAQTLLPGCGGTCVPFFDALHYRFGIENLPTRLVSVTVGLMQAFYPNLFAGLTARPIGGRFAFITEFFLRFVTLVAFPLVVAANFGPPDAWLLCLSIGLVTPALTQILCYQLAIRTLKKAQGVLSTVSSLALDDNSLKNFGQWGISLLYYIIGLFILWIGLRVHFLHDIWAYTFIALMVNVLFCVIKDVIKFAPGARGSLCRAFIAGERLEAAATP